VAGPGEATILHADLDAFYASVEQRDDHRLRGRPVIVGGGVVLACSYQAKARGVRTAMGGRQARVLCPEAIVVPPRMAAYTAASRAVFEVFRQTTPLVEGLSIDEAFLEVGGLWRIRGSPAAIAARLRREVAEQVGLPITVGVARTKFLAKVASGVSKPDGLLVVPPDGELAFLHPLPVGRLWGVGPVTATRLAALHITTVGQVAQLGEAALVSILGPAAGRHLHALAHNRDPRPVKSTPRRHSMGAQHALGGRRWTALTGAARAAGPIPGADLVPARAAPTVRAAGSDAVAVWAAELDAVLAGLVERVARRLRGAGRSGRTVVLRLRYGDFSRATRSRTLPHATARTQTLLDAARGLLAAALPTASRRGLTLVGVAVDNLSDAPEQLELPLDPYRDAGLDAALDAVRERFGTTAVSRGTLLGRDTGLVMPMLPD
jgi:nucleotidyltransferase/DNA polymerase involved in DNA repair